MKHKLIVTALALLMVTGIVYAQEIKLSAELWNRWTLENAKAPADSENTITKNSLALERGYLGLEAKFSETIKGRFTIDLFSTDALKDGAGLKLKYGYVDFARLVPVPEMTVTAGLQKVYFGTIYDWDYTLIGKAPTDEYKVANSADYGLTLNGYIPGGWGEYAAGIYNGEGYKNFGINLKDNTDFAYLANLRLTPLPGVTVGGSYMYNTVEREHKLTDGTVNNAYNKQNLIDGVVRLAYGPVQVWGEYIMKDVKYHADFSSKDYTANGIMVMPVLSFKDISGVDLQLVGRYDRWDETDNTASANLLNAYTVGVNYGFLHDETAVPAMQLQLNYTGRSYDESESAAAYANGMKDSTQLMLQLKWRFANTIK